jgi:tetratricopeptide (TPR) repeat protein
MLGDNIFNSAEANLILGNYELAITQYQEVMDIAASIDNKWLQAWGLTGMGYISLERGNLGMGIEMFSDSIEIVDRIGIDLLSAGSRAHLAYAYLMLGDHKRGRELAENALAIVHSESYPSRFRTSPLAEVARAMNQLGDQDTSASLLNESYTQYDPSDFIIPYLKQVSFTDAELALTNGNPNRAIEVMDELINQLRERGARSLLPEALLIKGKALIEDGKATKAIKILEEARAESERLGERRQLWMILFELAKLEAELGNSARAEELHIQAREVIAYIADHIDDKQLRASFLSLPTVSGFSID